MAKQGFVSNEMIAGRLLSHGKIESLEQAMTFDVPVSIVIIPKVNIAERLVSRPTAAGLLVDCKMYQDDNSSDYFIPFLVETPASIKEIAADAIELATYDVYWSAGDYTES